MTTRQEEREPMAGRLLPEVHDVDTEGFWAAANDGRLAVQVCTSCGSVLHMPRSYCRFCKSWAVEWRSIGPTARLYAWITVDRQLHPSFPVPYTVVLVEPDDAPQARLVGHLPGVPELHVGQEMQLWFERLDEETVLPQWKPKL